ncbi:cupin domain-containing protein [Nocardia donostiensis]|uniref:Cupin type-2 domain-containing protein n=1 Tax=Nocardia donostiensis TaxID=1538463 RepID=A0A1W0ASI5_9NOCA|nr:cupin domain-containing protein [Nocardia donostiensis]ONM46847.1 hypothetical protein B0T46_20390 [Nocardia donostiensis]OQS13196.1 hypothetical protein B0T36_20440 [Nocardia donostiensis]OQS19105.1 hypothetical protein B0T44_15690 [Nocardia donostiensis]
MKEARTLTFRSGHRITLLAEGSDENGPYLRLRHELPHPRRQAGPHWHPVLSERWTVHAGCLRFRIDGREIVAGPGDTVSAPARTVHEFWSEEPDTVVVHEIRPPLQHWRMFTVWRNLDNAGKTGTAGVPRNPLALALLWSHQDGYLAGIPPWLQRALLGGLARVTRMTGYEQRWSSEDAARS